MNITTNCELGIIGNRDVNERWLLTEISIDITQNLRWRQRGKEKKNTIQCNSLMGNL